MNIACNGRQLKARQAELLLSVLEPDLTRMMQATGFRLLPIRAPRIVKGDLVVRFAWEKCDGGARTVIRGKVTFPRPAAL